MKEWFTAQEIADAGLPDLPTTKRGVSLLAEREGWANNPAFARARGQRGGGFEYHYKLWPTLAQIEHQKRHLTVAAPAVADLPVPAPLSGRGATERDARLAILAAFEQFTRGARLGHKACLQVFSDKYNMRSLAIEGWIVDLVPKISKRSLERWQGAKRAGTFDQLAVDRSKARKGTGFIDTAENGRVRTFVLAVMAQNPWLSATSVQKMCQDEFPALTMPPVRTFQHAMKVLKASNAVALTKLTNPDLYRSTLTAAGVGTYRHLNAPNQLWQIDASPIDALCNDGRHTIYACIDIFTRRTVFLVSRTPRASAVALLIRKAIQAWGVPVQIKTDNGSDFVAQDTKRLFASLDIHMDLSDAYQPQQKGHVERIIKTFQHDFAALLPGFIGHSVADRKIIENRKAFSQRLGETEAETFGVGLSGQRLQGLVDQWAETVYEARPHGGLQGRSPREVFQASNAKLRTVDIRALDLLLMPVAGKDGRRTTTKFGLRIDGRHYATPTILPGVDVLVRQDPSDMGKVYAFALDGGEFLGEGICPELAGIDPAQFLKTVREMQAEALDEVTRPIKKRMKELAKGPAPIERILRQAVEQSPNVIPLPKRTEEHSTAQIAAALDAMDAIDGKVPTRTVDPAVAAEQQRLISLMDAPEGDLIARHEEQMRRHETQASAAAAIRLPSNVVALETPKTRYRRALAVMAAIQAGTADPGDAFWLGQYQTTAEFKAEQVIHQDFGDAYLT
ncbi:DDE-type integrase/transposase/recombinase [Paradevosia shaoguanensis]|uniref:DDE-type integrase/transposase/recombinase n=1 Tax=Paradevosia shaoguanensis TaxID=1335043 RepID=A0AA41QRQ5_9HYPH|nr:DDE-type integrase/transposase/recombinase [Paradevosia shaoguanensis]MCF1744655.1 DDE-type integrase/transposase/recombinase [Paradevosia shaoguanensis]MCI0129138.1 DDE-type integrase/transposase/recombinase [Paradevosia shaoguanensis]